MKREEEISCFDEFDTREKSGGGQTHATTNMDVTIIVMIIIETATTTAN